MAIVSIPEVKAHLSQLLKRVARGEQVLIAQAGKPIAKLVPYETRKEPRKPGSWQGRNVVAEDFDLMPTELLAGFRGETD